jgi:hypothetical protein
MKIYYLAHPVRGDDQFSEEENLEHALLVQGLLYEAGIFTVNPWYTFIKLYPNVKSPEDIEQFLKEDCAVLERLDGVVLVGHKLSDGMRRELNHALSNDLDIVNYIGIPDNVIAKATLTPPQSK